MNRPAVVRFKFVPTKTAALQEWFRRLVDLNGGVEPAGRGWLALLEIDRNFGALSARQYRDLGRKYGATHLVIRTRSDLDLPVLYAANTWSVHSLD